MDMEDVKEVLAYLQRQYDYCNDVDSPIQREIDFWRNKFLKDNHASDNLKICAHFHALPSAVFMKKSPESHLKEISNFITE